MEKLYLPTLTLSTEADFHRGRAKNKITKVIKEITEIVTVTYIVIYK